jgi:hypothetical protein
MGMVSPKKSQSLLDEVFGQHTSGDKADKLGAGCRYELLSRSLTFTFELLANRRSVVFRPQGQQIS